MLEGVDQSTYVGFEAPRRPWVEPRPRVTPEVVRPEDWPAPGPIDLTVHDLPHASSTTEWWYLKAHVETADGRPFSLFAAFFRVLKGRNEQTGKLEYAHSLTWAISDPQRRRYVSQSLVDPDAPRLGVERIDRGEGARDPLLRRAMREVCVKGHVPYPDQMLERDAFVDKRRLQLEYDDCRLEKTDDGCYELTLWNDREKVGATLAFEPRKQPVRHGDDGVVKGSAGEDMFYYFIPRCDVRGKLRVDGASIPVTGGQGWYDHEFGRHPEGEGGL
ncbi:MAG: carotenoid 1,2-hydratase, partial [Deltaproteobacteria bacterium]|nr:carotenoid 1,2-hydratase [Deltaproteobacteria bacterium]